MTDPYRPEGSDQPWQNSEPPTVGFPPYVDPAYAGQLPTYPPGYPPQAPNPTQQLPRQHWEPPPPPPDGPVGGGQGGPPEPPRFPNWLFLVAGAAVLLVVGMVIALVITNGSQRNTATAPPMTPVTPLPTAPSTPAPTRVPTTPPSPTPSRTPAPRTTTTPPPTASTTPAVPETIVYSVTGTGKALSIAYIDTGGMLKTEFNVTLPWSKQVTLTPPATTAAAVTVVNFGEQVTCALSVDGAQVRQRTGSILTVCAAAG
ncbi:MmpS family transport accessory protein [[Mycobacterium] kokjensenii]|uniref:MmpS family transport accessory protein n=1 Tax=[Mycobacterium] kokjensenii TaxID=3064287 RepID=A0ABM9LAP6_9MYCO|nr:MmpS family transport accessory protein [Mycolicibacter sp. MU0083]CAJ1495720.1 MmpS family transport accessory protein [Mycolicibacter sp. MU0083]